MARKLTDKELNAKLMESLNITSADAKNAFNELMREKVAEIRKEVRQEVFEELSKQANYDKQNIIESLNQIAEKTITEEKKKNDIHRKNLIKEKLALKEAKENIDKEIADKTALIKENFNKKLKKVVEAVTKKYEAEKQDFISKASDFINENMKKEVINLRNDKKQLAEALDQFGKFISEQVSLQVKEHKKEMKSLDNLRVRLVKESAEELANTKKKFFTEAAEKIEKFTNAAMARELKEFRKDIAESRKNKFGAKIFESFAKEFAVKFFNQDEVVKSMMKSVKASHNRLNQSNKVLESKLDEANEKINNLSKVNQKLTREKIINESISHLSKDKQDMIKNIIKEVPTEKLVESINRYIPIILGNNGSKSINKNEKVLKEGRTATFLTGEDANKKLAIQNYNNEEVLSKDLEDQINEVIANTKMKY